jgi:DNA-directed RNA polymerase specialized sigma24 family protein
MAKATTPELQVDQSMAGVLALLVAEREERLLEGGQPRKTEAILASAGLLPTQIASLTGKNPDAVRKAIQRSRTKPKKRKK